MKDRAPQPRTQVEEDLLLIEERQEVLAPGDLTRRREKIEVGKNG
jgi:hypothetical protein